MNIFAIHQDPEIAAQSLCDTHVNKMITETAQMLCTNLRHFDLVPEDYTPTNPEDPEIIYRACYKNHPCTVWARTSLSNWKWLVEHGEAMVREKYYRYGPKVHKAVACLEWASKQPLPIPDLGLTPFAQALGDFNHLASDDPVASYRLFYKADKTFRPKTGWKASWTKNRPAPQWWHDLNSWYEREIQPNLKAA